MILLWQWEDTGQRGVYRAVKVVFSDANLETAMKSLLNITIEQPVTQSDLGSLIDVDLSNKKIANLQGLEYAVNVTQLNLSGNEIADISSLKKLTKIRSLSLRENKITSIEDLAAMKDLEYLHVGWNQISSLEVVKQLPGLNALYANSNQISNLQGLSDAVEMTYLDLRDNKLVEVESLSKLTKLINLDVSDNQIQNITSLAKLINLNTLSIAGNKITDFKPLAGLVNLSTLNISNSNMTDLKPLTGLVRLGNLNESNNNIKDLAPLTGLTGLSQLNLSSNQIYNLEPLRNLRGLVALYLSNNRVWNLEPIQNIAFDSSIEYDHGVELYNNNLDLSKGSKTSKLLSKTNKIGSLKAMEESQGKTQRLIIGSKTAYLGDSNYNITEAPFIQTGRTYVPIRFISEKLGAALNWNQAVKEVTIQKDGKTIRWIVGNKQVKVNEQTVTFDAPLLQKNNSTFVPVRFVSEQLNTSVEYIDSKKMAIIFENRTA